MSTQLEHAKLEDIDSLLESQEKMIRDLRPGTEKKVLWAQGNGVKSKTSIVFIHGFSASRIEIDPVVDLIAAELNANVYFTRLRGHGQDGKALAEATYEQFLDDMIEAIEIGKTIGDDVVLMGCSTGCSLIHIVLAQEHNIKAAIYISPNFGPKPLKGQALRLPGAKFLVPLVFGKKHSFITKSAEHARCWTTSYPTMALFSIKETVLAAHQIDHWAIKVPIMMWFSDEDKVVNAKWTRKIASMMGDNVTLYNPLLTKQDDPSCHGIIGNILSPSQTTIAVKKIINWLTQI
tara:strand:+ start:68 stop:940 length:873 start_codon:yes stop_codon:yes gene_type:complete